MALSAVLSFAAAEIIGNAGYVLAAATLLIFVLLGIVFDMVGVAVTAADSAPFHGITQGKRRKRSNLAHK